MARKIAYDVTGSGPVVILLARRRRESAFVARSRLRSRLAKEFTVVTMDIRGNGDSDKPPMAAAFSPTRLNQDVLAVANAVKAERFVIWGFSYGANVGRYLAAVSDRVRGMVYIGIPFGAAADGMFRERILGMPTAPRGWPRCSTIRRSNLRRCAARRCGWLAPRTKVHTPVPRPTNRNWPAPRSR